MGSAPITIEEFLKAAQEFVKTSDNIHDGWRLHESAEIYRSYIKKETFIEHRDVSSSCLLKAEYVILYHLSYAVPAFSFNIWNAAGMLLTLEEIRKMSLIQISEKEFYSVVTQQEHPIFQRPYYMMHPCHTEELLSGLRNHSRNIIVTFLGLITPLLPLKLSMEYGL